jgi:hypothetical protein
MGGLAELLTAGCDSSSRDSGLSSGRTIKWVFISPDAARQWNEFPSPFREEKI